MSKEVVTGTDLNSNSTATTTASMNVDGVTIIGLHIKEASGNHAAAVWRMYCSPDNTNWFRTIKVTAAQVNGTNSAEVFDTRGTQFIRFQIDTASSGSGTEDITIIG